MTSKAKFGSIQRIDHDHYLVVWGRGRDANGKRIRHSKHVHGTLREAEAFLAAKAAEGYKDVKATDWQSFWRESVEPGFDQLATKTAAEYQRLWHRELEPRIGSMPVRDTDWQTVERVLDDIQSASVQRHAFAVWRKACNIAVKHELLTRNPCDRTIKLKRHRKAQPPIVTDVTSFMASIRGLKYEPALLVMLGGGLRVEECAALLWSDVRPHQTHEGTYLLVDVNKAAVTVSGGTELKETKTATSTRTVVIGEPFASRIEQLRDVGTVMPCAPQTFTHNWRSWCQRHGLEYVRPMSLRSSYATLCGEAGCPDSLTSMQMGHTDGSTKGRNYQRATLKGGMLVADLLADYVGDMMRDGIGNGIKNDILPGQKPVNADL